MSHGEYMVQCCWSCCCTHWCEDWLLQCHL